MSSVTGRQLLSLQLGNFLPEGRYLDVDPTTGLIILANNNFVYLLDSRTGEYRGVYQAKTQVVAIKYCCPDYNRLLIAGETSTQILHLPTMSVIKSTKLSSASGKDERKESIKSADWHSNEPVIAVGTDSGKLRIWDLRKEVEDMCQVGSKRETLCWLEFSPNLVDRNLLAIGIIGRVVIYDWMSSNACRSINVRGELQSICWSPEIDLGLLSDSNGVAAQHSRYLAIGCNITGGTGQVNICQPHSGQIVREIRVKIPLTGRAHLPLIWLEQCCLAVINNREINIFDLSRKPNVNPVTKSPFGHLKTVLGMVATSDCFVTFGMDRQLIIWDRNTLDIRQRVPFVSFAEICCLEVSTDGSLVTYAASTDAERSKGPREIGLWRVGSRSQWYDHIFNWFNLSSSLILCLSFHPGLDGSVLYGMADGKYGVMALRGQANDRSPEKSYLFAHCFGAGHPVFQVASSPNPSAFWLLAEGKIYQQSVKRINDPPQEVKLPSKNEMISRFAFNSTFTRLAVGYRAGVVEVFSVHPDIRLLWNFELPLTDNNVVVHLAFHPTRPLLAAADVNKLGIVYVYEMPDSLSEMNLKPSVKFDTHGKKVQSITWSPGETANLAVAFGGAPPKAGVIVYNYDRREVLGFYRGHQRRPRCVRFNPDNPDELFSAGDDGFVLRWRLSDLKRNLSSPTPPVEIETQMESVIDSEIAPYTTMEESEDIGYGSIRTNGHDGPLTEQQSFKLPPNGIRPHNQQQTALNFSQTEDGLIGGEKRNKRRSEVIGNFRVRYDEISSRQEEMDKIVNDWPSSAQNGTSSGASQPSDCHGRTNDLERNGLAKYGEENADVVEFPEIPRGQAKGKWEKAQIDVEIVRDSDVLPDDGKKKGTAKRSLFDRLQKLETSTKAKSHQDIAMLLNWESINDNQSQVTLGAGDYGHFGFYCDQKIAFKAIQSEMETYNDNGLTNAGLALSLFTSAQSEAIISAANQNCLNDYLVSVAAGVSYETYQYACLKYAGQLAEAGLVLKAATYYLAIGKVRKAIELLVEKLLFRDAVMLARARLSPDDPMLKWTFDQWTERAQKVGDYEQMAKNLVVVGDLPGAARTLLKRSKDVNCLSTAYLIAIKSNNSDLIALCARELIAECLRTFKWAQAREAASKHETNQAWSFLIVCHEVLVMCLCSLFVHIHTDTPVDLNSFSLSLDNADDLLTEVFQYWVKNYGKILPTTSEDVDKVVEVFVDFFIESATTSLLDKLPSLAANATAALLYAAVDTEKALKSVRKMLETVRTIPDAHEILSTAVQKGTTGPFAGISESLQKLLAKSEE